MRRAKRRPNPSDPATPAVQREIGERIRRARLAAQLTQEQAAHEAGIDAKRFQRLELGQVNATINTLARVARALGLTFWALLDTR